MIYEFFGLPGAGKTFCARKCAEKTNIPLIEIHGRFQLYFWATLFACIHPKIFFVILQKMIEENGGDTATAFLLVQLFGHKMRNLSLRAIAKEGKALFEKNAVIDEGLTQTLLYIFERKIEEKDISFLLCLFPKRTICIVTANTETRKSRMKIRGRIPREFLNREYRGRLSSMYVSHKDAYRERKWFPTIEHNFNVVVSMAKKAFPCKEIRNE